MGKRWRGKNKDMAKLTVQKLGINYTTMSMRIHIFMILETIVSTYLTQNFFCPPSFISFVYFVQSPSSDQDKNRGRDYFTLAKNLGYFCLP